MDPRPNKQHEPRYLRRNLKYLRYLIAHKWYVLDAGVVTRAPLWRLLIHDWSKFTPAEWGPYRDYFYLTKDFNEDSAHQRRLKAAFDKAWIHHLHKNPHHWEYWSIGMSGKDNPVPMPREIMREMVADWCGAGRVITGDWDADKWYPAQTHLKLHPDTRLDVEHQLKMTLGELRSGFYTEY
jgi:hypothetical protein